MTNYQDNLFVKAVKNKELTAFAFGQGSYFIADREYGEHWVLGAWQQHVLPFLAQNTAAANKELAEMFKAILADGSHVEAAKFDNLLYHLHVFYYFKKQGEINEAISMKGVENEINLRVKNYKKQLGATNQSEKLQEVQETINGIHKNGGLLAIKDIKKVNR